MHWQYEERGDAKECRFVKSFDGFKAVGKSRKVVAGHRNCPGPAAAQTMFNMCPDNNEVTYMWRNTDDKFYNPDIGLGGQSVSHSCF